MSVVHETLARRIVFGAGAIGELPAELARLGLRRPLVIAGRSQAPYAERLLAEVGAGDSLIGVRVHVPSGHAEAARARAAELAADCLVSIGGGSAVGLAKAVALTESLPIAAVPTTYAGSELTTVWGITEEGRKTTGKEPGVAPRLVVYDPELTYDLPPAVTAASGMNAVAHCVEALWAPGATPLTDIAASEGLRLLAAGVRGSLRAPRDPGRARNRAHGRMARGRGIRGRWRAAPQALPRARRDVRSPARRAARGAAAVHGGVPAARRRRRPDAASPPRSTRTIRLPASSRSLATLGTPRSLAALGLTEDDAVRAAAVAAPDVPDLPRRPTPAELEDLLRRAVRGAPV